MGGGAPLACGAGDSLGCLMFLLQVLSLSEHVRRAWSMCAVLNVIGLAGSSQFFKVACQQFWSVWQAFLPRQEVLWVITWGGLTS